MFTWGVIPLHRAPHLVAVIVGDDGASSVYVSNKTKAAQKCGIAATTKKLGKQTTQQELLDLVDSLNKDNEVSNLAQLSYNRYRIAGNFVYLAKKPTE